MQTGPFFTDLEIQQLLASTEIPHPSFYLNEQLKSLCLPLISVATGAENSEQFTATNHDHINALAHFLKNTNIAELDFNSKIKDSFFTPLWIILLLKLKCKSAFDVALSNIDFSTTDLNEACPEGFLEGASLMLFLVVLAFKQDDLLASYVSKIDFSKIDINVKPLSPLHPNQGHTILWFASQLALYGKPEFLNEILAKSSLAHCDINAQTHKENNAYKGISVMWNATELAVKGRPELLNALLAAQDLKNVDLNSACQGKNEITKGITLIWRALALANRGMPRLLETMLANADLTTIDINACPQADDHENKGQTVLWLAADLALKGEFAALNEILLKVDIKNADVNAKPLANIIHKGQSVMWNAAALAIMGHPALLDTLLAKIDIASVDINAKSEANNNINKGLSVFYIAILLHNYGKPAFLNALLARADLSRLDVSTIPSGQHAEQGKSIMWHAAFLALNGKSELLTAILAKVDIKTLDVNTKAHTPKFKDMNVMWVAMLLAQQQMPALLDAILDKVDVTQIDFNTRLQISSPRDLNTTILEKLIKVSISLKSPDFLLKLIDKMPYTDGVFHKEILRLAKNAPFVNTLKYAIKFKQMVNTLDDAHQLSILGRQAVKLVAKASECGDVNAYQRWYAFCHENLNDLEYEFFVLTSVPASSSFYNEANVILAEYLLSMQLSAQGKAVLNQETDSDKEARLLKAFEYALNINGKHVYGQHLRTAIAVAYLENSGFPSQLKPESLISVIKGDKETCVSALKLEKARLLQIKEIETLKKQLEQFQQKPIDKRENKIKLKFVVKPVPIVRGPLISTVFNIRKENWISSGFMTSSHRLAKTLLRMR